MPPLKSILQRNLLTAGMLLFTICFYLFLAIMSLARHGAMETGTQIKAEQRISSQNLKEKEATFRKNLESKPRLSVFLGLLLLAVVSLGIAFDIYLLRRKIKGLRLFPTPLPQSDVRWGIAEVWKVLLFLFFIEAVVIYMEILFSELFHWKGPGKDLTLMANSLFRDMAVAGLVIYLVKRRFRVPLSQIGLTTRNLFKNIATGIFSYIAVVPVLLVIIFFLAILSKAISYEPPPQPVVEMYLKEFQRSSLVFFTFFVAIVGPAIEEIFFRGFAYKAFRTRFGVPSAMVATSGIFALLHLNLIAFLPIFTLGLFLSALYEKTGSLVPCMTLHMIHNLIMVGLTLGFKTLSV